MPFAFMGSKKLTPAEKALALRVKARLAELSITPKDIAVGTCLSVRSVRDVLNSRNQSPRTRRQVTQFVGEELWPGIELQPKTVRLGDAERALLRSKLEQLAALGDALRAANDDPARAAIRAKAAALMTTDFVSAWKRATQLNGAAFVLEFAPITAPFRVELLTAMGCEVSETPGGGMKIRLSADLPPEHAR